jgi:RimJ/RimL family protein N-acetyltransferase
MRSNRRDYPRRGVPEIESQGEEGDVGSPESTLIATERLDIRPLRSADLGTILDLYSDPDAMRWAGGATTDVEESERRLQRLIDHQEEHGFSLWAVIERDSGTLMGDCGLIHYAFKGPEVELGFRLKVPFWGKGYATEAARAVLAYGFEEVGLDRIVAVAHPDNVASQRVLEKVGMRREGFSEYNEKKVLYFAAGTERGDP